MASLAVLASGEGTNFEHIHKALSGTSHSLECLICDRKNANVIRRAQKLDIPSFYVSYKGRSREAAELEIISHCRAFGVQFLALAGFMRVLTKVMIDAFPGKIINIHPSLLPRFPGVRGIERSYNSNDTNLGITIHYVDESLDEGPVILQKSFKRISGKTLEDVEKQIHALEYKYYPKVIIEKLNTLDAT
jgi:phosphoribosylglycinamide formyltransferase-1